MFESHIFKELKEYWVLQLHSDYDDICYHFGIKLKKPILYIDDLKNSWGHWDAERKTIIISQKLIHKFSWEVVLQVLKHEMAHQIVSDLFQVEDSHGAYFLKACRLIGLDPEYCRASISLEEKFIHWKDRPVQSDETTLMNKIQKLLNLAQSSNENEAALAMERVQELYEKYNLDKAKNGHKQDYYKLVLNFKKKRIPIAHTIAATILQDHFFVRIVCSSLYDSLMNQSHKTIEILGSRENVLMAEYVFHFLMNRIDILWINYCKQKQLSIKYKISYQRGILEGFSKKLSSSKKSRENYRSEHDPQVQGLLKLNDIQLKEFVEYHYPKLTKRGGSSRGVYTEHFQEGIEEGKKMNLNKPIQHKGNVDKRLYLR